MVVERLSASIDASSIAQAPSAGQLCFLLPSLIVWCVTGRIVTMCLIVDAAWAASVQNHPGESPGLEPFFFAHSVAVQHVRYSALPCQRQKPTKEVSR